jgi:hypothetical protein
VCHAERSAEKSEAILSAESNHPYRTMAALVYRAALGGESLGSLW